MPRVPRSVDTSTEVQRVAPGVHSMTELRRAEVSDLWSKLGKWGRDKWAAAKFAIVCNRETNYFTN